MLKNLNKIVEEAKRNNKIKNNKIKITLEFETPYISSSGYCNVCGGRTNSKILFCVKCGKPICSRHAYKIEKLEISGKNKGYYESRYISVGRFCFSCNKELDLIKESSQSGSRGCPLPQKVIA